MKAIAYGHPMSLRKYTSKRILSQSKEPQAVVKKNTKHELRFVVQEHAARHLHYDLRLEVHGVLKSWAIPKGPSMNPHDKRLAIMVEDHPYDYQYFHGTIPAGYGAGKVAIWDKGTYHVDNNTSLDSEKLMKKGLLKGEIRFTLKGKKLKGEFVLVKLKRSEKGNEWLLIKRTPEKPQLSIVTNRDKIFWPKKRLLKVI